MAAERRRRTSEAAARLAREAEEEEAAGREEMRARKEAAEARRKEDERWIFQLESDLVTQIRSYTFIRDNVAGVSANYKGYQRLLERRRRVKTVLLTIRSASPE